MATGAYPSAFYPGQVYPSQPVGAVQKQLPQDLRVEVAFGSGADDPAPKWQDVTSYVDLFRGFQRNNYGRLDQYATIGASTCTIGLDNTDGRFSPGNASSPYYPNVTAQKRVRVSYRDSSVAGNFLSAEDASFEGGTVGSWVAQGGCTIANSTTHAADGTHALLITWPTGGTPWPQMTVTGLVIGRSYTMTAKVYSAAGVPDIRCTAFTTNVNGTPTSVKGAFATITVTWTASQTSELITVSPSTAPTSGQQTWLDAVQVDETSAATGFTTAAPVVNYRFTGHTTSWATDWPTGGDATSNATLNASDRLARIGAIRTLRSIVEEEILYDDPLAYYTLTEAAGSTGAGNTAGTVGGSLALRQVGTGGTLTFAQATGTRFDGASSPTWARGSATGGVALYGKLPDWAAYPTQSHLRGSFNTTTNADMLFAAGVDGFGSWWGIGVNATGHVQARSWNTWSQSWEWTLASPNVYTDGQWHDVMLNISISGGTVTVSLCVDDLTGASVASTSYAANGYNVPSYAWIGGLTGWMWDGSIGHVAFYIGNGPTAARIGQQVNAVLHGCAGESTDARIARLARLVNIDPTEQALDAGSTTSCSFQDTAGKSAFTCMQDIAQTESGRLFIDGSGKLVFHSRARKWSSQSPDVTIDANVLDPGTGFALDFQGMVNDATAQTPNGPVQRAQDATSQTTFGVMSASPLTVFSTKDSDALDLISYQVATHSTPQARTPAAPLDVLTTGSTGSSLLGLELGKRLRVTGLPSQAPASQVDLMVEGWSESWTVDDVSITPNTVSTTPDLPWILEDATYGALDGDNRLIY